MPTSSVMPVRLRNPVARSRYDRSIPNIQLLSHWRPERPLDGARTDLRTVIIQRVGLPVALVGLVLGVAACTSDAKTANERHATGPALAGHVCHSTIGHVVSGFTGLSGSERLTLECVHTRSHGDLWVGKQSITTPGCIYTTRQCPPNVTKGISTTTTVPNTAPTGGPPTLETPRVCTPYGPNYRCQAGDPCPAPVSGTKDDLSATGVNLVCTRTDSGTTGYTWQRTPTSPG